MDQSEGKQKRIPKPKIITLELTEMDVEVLLSALGMKQVSCYDNRVSSKPVDIMIEKIYRKLGTRLG